MPTIKSVFITLLMVSSLLAQVLAATNTPNLFPLRLEEKLVDFGQFDDVNHSGMATIDVLFVYSTSVPAIYKESVNIRFSQLIDSTNKIFKDSGVHIVLRTAGYLETSFPDSIDATSALFQLTEATHPAFTNVLNKRYLLGADLVVLARPMSTSELGGFSWRNGDRGNISAFSEKMFSYISVDHYDYVLAHEIGHNLGLGHSRLQEPKSGSSFDFAVGYGIENDFVTIMANKQTFNANQKIYQFSNPQLTCNNIPCGHLKDGGSNSADASYALNSVRFQAQDMQSKNNNLTLSKDSLLKIADLHFKSCILAKYDLIRFNYAGMLPQLNCDNSAINTISGIDEYFNIHTLNLADNLISDISSLKFLPKLVSLNLESNSIKDISTLLLSKHAWLSINLTNNHIYCWQLAYIEQFMQVLNLQLPAQCDASDDDKDFDQDGITNHAELALKQNPIIHNLAGGIVQFSRNTYSFNEFDKTLNIPLIRRDGNNGNLELEVTIIDGSAKLNEDYIAPIKTITFAHLQNEQMLTIQLIDDQQAESTEHMLLNISNKQPDSGNAITQINIDIFDNDVDELVMPAQTSTAEKQQSSKGQLSYFYLIGLLLLILLNSPKP